MVAVAMRMRAFALVLMGAIGIHARSIEACFRGVLMGMFALLVLPIFVAVIGGLLVGVSVSAMGMVTLAVASACRKGSGKHKDKKDRPNRRPKTAHSAFVAYD
ncbi:hypothetical protein [Salinibacter sp.]|uniref:hypothetical protein n=1 Tax=Salinibacter sp. TaxID=2065818 RepID=UPI0021E7C864|nr:hypothetical protein [Salinibacter sp.]